MLYANLEALAVLLPVLQCFPSSKPFRVEGIEQAGNTNSYGCKEGNNARPLAQQSAHLRERTVWGPGIRNSSKYLASKWSRNWLCNWRERYEGDVNRGRLGSHRIALAVLIKMSLSSSGLVL